MVTIFYSPHNAHNLKPEYNTSFFSNTHYFLANQSSPIILFLLECGLILTQRILVAFSSFDTSFESWTHTETMLEEPKLYRVLLLNDDWTAMDFVAHILMEVFDKSMQEAKAITLKVHNEGKGVCGIYPYDIAELKTQLVSQKAKEQGYPLRVITEELH